MDTEQIMRLALKMAGMKTVPADSGIFVRGKNVRKALFSVDVSTSELLLAKELGCDLVIAHHPIGPAMIDFPQVVTRHVEFMVEKGVPRRVAKQATDELISKLEVRRHASNYQHVVSAAKQLGMPLMNIHLPLDQITREFLLDTINGSGSKTPGELILRLQKIAEFRDSATEVALMMGKPTDSLGRWVLVFAAGTNGGYPVAKAYMEHGVKTVIYLHIEFEELLRLRKECKGNLIVLGHMAGDSIGINIFLRELARREVRAVKIGVIA
jgi:putative NIF3 family GTP cyclohydrolase 1 type 2